MKKKLTEAELAANNKRAKEYYWANREKVLEYHRNHRKANIERTQKYDRDRYKDRREERIEYQRQLRIKRPEMRKMQNADYKKRNPDTHYFVRIKRNYGLTKEGFEKLLADQGGKCKICSVSTPGGKGRWHIDHDHSKECPKAIRGLLCCHCNVMLGQAKDNIETLKNAIKYLEDYTMNSIPE